MSLNYRQAKSSQITMRVSYLFVALAIFCSACSRTRKAPNGFQVNVVREGDGAVAKPGEFLVVNLLYKDSRDSIWDDSRRRSNPMIIPVADTSAIKKEKGMESAFRILKKGDSVTIKATAKSFFEDTWSQQVPVNIKPETEITFYLGVVDILDQEGVASMQQKMQAAENERNMQMQAGQLALDTAAIDNYLSEKKIMAMKDKSGLRYVVTRQGTGTRPSLASTIVVNYKGSLMTDGRVFDQSKSPLEYPLNGFIQGWQIGFSLLPKGSRAVLYIPSSLGYGANGYPPDIPANANLIFEVELVDIK